MELLKDKLIKKIESDLNIKRFTNEIKRDYYQRIIYSVGAAWSMNLIYGDSYGKDKDYNCVDIMYVHTHLQKVLEAYLKCFDTNEDWFDEFMERDIKSKASALASEIIDVTINIGNIGKIQGRLLVPVEEHAIKYKHKLYLIKGTVQNRGEYRSVGVATWKRGEISNSRSPKKIVDLTATEYIRYITNEFQWTKKTIEGSFEIFTLGKSGGYSRCWRRIEIDKVPDGIQLLRLRNVYNGGYILIKKEETDIKVVELDPWYFNSREVYRIMYALNNWNGTPAIFQADIYGDYVLLKCRSALPDEESKLLQACSWPYRTYMDRYYRVIPKFLWEVVEDMLIKLGIIIEK